MPKLSHTDSKGKASMVDVGEKPNQQRTARAGGQIFLKEETIRLIRENEIKKGDVLTRTDYKGWAYGLKAAGYATHPQYAEMLIKVIEDNKLYIYDQAAGGVQYADTSAQKTTEHPVKDSVAKQPVKIPRYSSTETDFDDVPLSESPRKLFSINGVRCVKAKKRDKVDKIAADFGLAPFDILRYNDMPKGYVLSEGEIVFIEPKKKNCETEYHTVNAGETMFVIAQLYGVQLNVLYSRNHMKEGQEPSAGQKIWLKNTMPVY